MTLRSLTLVFMPMPLNRLSALKAATIFSSLVDQSHLLDQLAAAMIEVRFAAHHKIFSQGEAGSDLYILLSGRVRIHLQGLELAQLHPGACFGEMALFDPQPRFASATTLQPSACLVLTREQFEQAIATSPELALHMIQLLSGRIRKLNRMLGYSAEVSPPVERLSFLPF